MRARHERHECNTSATRVKNFDFSNDTSKNIFSRLQGEEQFHSKNYLLEMSRFHVKMRLKSAPQKLNFWIEKAISKSCTLVTHSKAASFFIKTILYEKTNILFSKIYWKLGKMNASFWKNIYNKGKVALDSFQNFAYVSNYMHLKEFCMETRLSNIFKTPIARIWPRLFNKPLIEFYKLHPKGKH